MDKKGKIKTALEILWNLKNDDKFYFVTYGAELLEELVDNRVGDSISKQDPQINNEPHKNT